MDRADVVLMVVDSARSLDEEERALLRREGIPLVIALNKKDLDAVTSQEELHLLAPGAAIVRTCAVTGDGVDTLRQALYDTALRGTSPEEAYLTSERHIEAARESVKALQSALGALESATMDCAALDLRAAWEALGTITGQNATEDVVDRIFQKFCLGK